MSFSFSASLRLKSKKLIQLVYKKGSEHFIYPFLVKYKIHKETKKSQVLFAVSSKNLPRAVDRNTVKRRAREAYRLQLPLVPIQHTIIIYIYVSKDVLDSETIHQKIKESLVYIKKHTNQNNHEV